MDFQTFLGRLFKQIAKRQARSSGHSTLTTFFSQYDLFMVEVTGDVYEVGTGDYYPLPYHAVVTDSFLESNTKLMVGEAFPLPTHIAVGTGILSTGDPRSLTSLVSEAEKLDVTIQQAYDQDGNLLPLIVLYSSDPTLARTWTEMGILDANNVLLARYEDPAGFYTKVIGEGCTVMFSIRPVHK